MIFKSSQKEHCPDPISLILITSLDFTFKLNTLYLVSVLFTREKFRCVYTHVKLTRKWKSTLRNKNILVVEKICIQNWCTFCTSC